MCSSPLTSIFTPSIFFLVFKNLKDETQEEKGERKKMIAANLQLGLFGFRFLQLLAIAFLFFLQLPRVIQRCYQSSN